MRRKTLSFVLSLMMLILPLISFDLGVATAGFSDNLLTNPGAESGSAAGWTILESGGSGWDMSDNWDGMIHSGTHSFRSSNGWGVMEQKVDLIAAGYSTSHLDSSPDIIFDDWVTSRLNGKYFVTYELLAGDGTTVITSNSGVGTSKGNPANIAGDAPWTERSYTFSGYGTGVRYALIRHGGYETVGWAGYYGPHFDDASITIDESLPSHTLTYTAGEGGTITGDATQTIVDGQDGSEVTATPDSGYEFVKWSDDSTTNPRTDLNITGDLSLSAEFRTETVPPTFSNLPNTESPINLTENETVVTNPFIIKVKPADQSGITKVEFLIDDILICTDTTADGDGIYSCPWDTEKYHSIVKVYAYDSLNNKSQVLKRTTIVDPKIYTVSATTSSATAIPTITELPATGKSR